MWDEDIERGIREGLKEGKVATERGYTSTVVNDPCNRAPQPNYTALPTRGSI
jgi:hypothetical protein